MIKYKANIQVNEGGVPGVEMERSSDTLYIDPPLDLDKEYLSCFPKETRELAKLLMPYNVWESLKGT